MTSQPTPDLLDLAEAAAAGWRTLADVQQGLDRSDAMELGRLVRAVSAVHAHALATQAAASERPTVVPDRATKGVSLTSEPTGLTDAVVAGQRVRGGRVRLGGVRPERHGGGAARWVLVAATIAVAGGLVAAGAFVGSRIPPARPATTTPNGQVANDASASPAATSSPVPTSSSSNVAGVGPDVIGDLTSVKMMSATVGWGTTSGAILRTADGGRTWTAVHDGRGAFTRFVDESTAAFIDGPPFDRIVTTHDGGQTWRTATITPPAQGGPLQLAFASANVGFATWWDDPARPGALAVFRTDDGGTTWTGPVAGDESDLPSYTGKAEAQGGDAGLIWATPGKADNQPFDNRFSLSADGGATWVVRPFPVDPLAPAGDLKAPESIRSDGAGHLVMVVGAVPAIFDSRDDGQTWTRTRVFPNFSPQIDVPSSIQLRTLQDWTAVAGDGSAVWSTADAGVTWSQVAPNLPVPLWASGTSVSFGSTEVGVVLDTHLLWSCHISSLMHSPNPDPICAPGQPRALLWATSDGGATWQRVAP